MSSGRTFPGHPYFANPLGQGQLALFNLLKAYSLIDAEVGYCQGISFVAGVLLMHVSIPYYRRYGNVGYVVHLKQYAM